MQSFEEWVGENDPTLNEFLGFGKSKPQARQLTPEERKAMEQKKLAMQMQAREKMGKISSQLGRKPTTRKPAPVYSQQQSTMAGHDNWVG